MRSRSVQGWSSTRRRPRQGPFGSSLRPRHGGVSSAAWNLDDVVRVVGDGHELREGWVAEDGVVGQADGRDVEVDLLGAVVLGRAVTSQILEPRKT